ncbi:5-oxoprolinase subunit C family protein [Larsenimonas rhizosphaerae]|uniref:Biotin-dependent carboxyltransferase family protein n=1 Tax=Larsenimonas rhizosphaerae TaxID=2944682 RepID=A0AA41ZEK6_9GAMM|nr:biotin-dependent carboxyltransferase family protein [Larsenimonas rhizosphaerae]MCX2523075.1 biotin-dependent carboxyltransferase family protein [Larsenimonas rhizosphaerae]
MSPSAKAHCHIEQAGGGCRLQDAGRFGVRHLGLGQGGAFDSVSMRQANQLLGNVPDAVVMEITLGQVCLSFSHHTTIALAGADLKTRLDDQPVAPGRTIELKAGQRLFFQAPQDGARTYLAVPDGFDVTAELGSITAIAREPLGGLHQDGRPLVKGDSVPFKASGRPARYMEMNEPWRCTDSVMTLDVLPGMQAGTLRGESLYRAYQQRWRVDERADSMGVRLTGEPIHSLEPQMISEGIVAGAIQVPPDGQPIILANDRQTIGGYPKIGALTPLALARLGQCLPGRCVRLKPVSRAGALAAWRDALAGIASAIHAS